MCGMLSLLFNSLYTRSLLWVECYHYYLIVCTRGLYYGWNVIIIIHGIQFIVFFNVNL